MGTGLSGTIVCSWIAKVVLPDQWEEALLVLGGSSAPDAFLVRRGQEDLARGLRRRKQAALRLGAGKEW